MEYRGARTRPRTNNVDANAVGDWAEAEFLMLGRDLAGYVTLDLTISYREPVKPRPGMLVCADGVEWNPGSGEGLYRFTVAGTWKYLG